MVLKKLGDHKTGILSLSIVQYILSKSEQNYFEVYDMARINKKQNFRICHECILDLKVIHKRGYILIAFNGKLFRKEGNNVGKYMQDCLHMYVESGQTKNSYFYTSSSKYFFNDQVKQNDLRECSMFFHPRRNSTFLFQT